MTLDFPIHGQRFIYAPIIYSESTAHSNPRAKAGGVEGGYKTLRTVVLRIHTAGRDVW